MKPLLQQVSNTTLLDIFTIISRVTGSIPSTESATRSIRPWKCFQCRHQSTNIRAREKPGLVVRNIIDQHLVSAQSRLISSSVRRAFLAHTASHFPAKGRDAFTSTKTVLPSQEEGRRSHISRRFTHLIDNLQSNIFIAGQRLNDLTGYSGIEALKKEIEEQEEQVRATRATLQQVKTDYTTAIAQRSASQREVNELLQRKHAWSPQDLERFTSLYRSDHANEQAETSAQEAVAAAERKAEEASSRLGSTILARYHEEQIWSDKIRRMSTWGTWGLMGMNVLLFMVFQIGVEPWRRKRLVKGFEEKVLEALEREGAATSAATGAALAALQATHVARSSGKTGDGNLKPVSSVMEVVEEASATEHDGGTVPDHLATTFNEPSNKTILSRVFRKYWRSIEDFFSERQVTVRKVDLTTKAIEGAFLGIAMASIFAAIIRASR